MSDDSLRDDHDSPWKEALSQRFPEFLALLFPQVHAGIDWSRGHDFLDKELQKYERAIILELLRIIDWMIRLPDGLERMLWREIRELEESTEMRYVTSVERFGLEQGRREGEAAVLLRQIERKFGTEAADRHRERIEQADAETLLLWSERILSAARADEIFDRD